MTREEITNSRAYQVSKAALEYYNEHHQDKDIDLTDAFEDGAKWADENPTPCSVKLIGNQSYLKRQLREMGFAFDLNGNVLSPNHLAKKAAQHVIEKACEWLMSELYHSEDRYGHPNVESRSYVSVEDFINNFKKAMDL